MAGWANVSRRSHNMVMQRALSSAQILKGLQDDVASIKTRRESILKDIEQMALEDREDAEKAAREAQAIADADAEKEDPEETELSEGEDEDE
ncbi:hypothetical protein L198_06641 [Cryptococcus wingfieldii CBS 7118]|uniref:Uncharacterized protein n=1 Tax=Cryptococcus wingfieldii CBS 7118 TaxID=1295528 RepID=A0A1E3IJQ6_9TREE|nr:hypothetical protein L198_06641 [Cryptococcus wingfieldii CBS 7118]ODN88839.1 hypothetical protein L198_06641 [Cryptococcus wingfieldii CBS 7118]